MLCYLCYELRYINQELGIRIPESELITSESLVQMFRTKVSVDYVNYPLTSITKYVMM